MTDNTDKIIKNIVLKVTGRVSNNGTHIPTPRKTTPTSNLKRPYKGLTWNKERKDYDYNLESCQDYS